MTQAINSACSRDNRPLNGRRLRRGIFLPGERQRTSRIMHRITPQMSTETSTTAPSENTSKITTSFSRTRRMSSTGLPRFLGSVKRRRDSLEHLEGTPRITLRTISSERLKELARHTKMRQRQQQAVTPARQTHTAGQSADSEATSASI